MQTLMLFDQTGKQAFHVLGTYAGLYGDNGGDPDGNCWLPSNLDEIPEELIQEVITMGYGRRVEVRTVSDEEMFRYWGYHSQNMDEELDESDFQFLQRMANENLLWAHYGAYGARDSLWVFIKPDGQLIKKHFNGNLPLRNTHSKGEKNV